VPLAETLANVTVAPPLGVTDTLVPEGVSPFTLKYFGNEDVGRSGSHERGLIQLTAAKRAVP
jgi:hypothetical protein